MKTIYYQFYPSPVGNLLLIAQAQGLIGIEFEHEQLTTSLAGWQAVEPQTSGQISALFTQVRQTLDRYFLGEKLDFRQLTFLNPKGTAFQQAVWQILLNIPFGQTRSYGDIAAELGKPKAMRAVGGAVGRNPISILIPCHRVIGKNQSLTGFGGGLPAKRYLLQLEHIDFRDQGVEFVNPKYKNWQK